MHKELCFNRINSNLLGKQITRQFTETYVGDLRYLMGHFNFEFGFEFEFETVWDILTRLRGHTLFNRLKVKYGNASTF